MANEEHCARLRAGADAWNAWRKEHRSIIPDLREANLREANLREVNLDLADLEEAVLTGAHLNRATLRFADLTNADLTSANLTGADLSGADFSGAALIEADLREANLDEAKLLGVNLSGAVLIGARLEEADLSWADLTEANLSGAGCSETVFANVDLSATKGLEACAHWGPSVLDHRTLQQSGRLPSAFLRGCGLSDWEIEAAKLHDPSLAAEQMADIVDRIHHLRATRPIQKHGLFISYSHADGVFLEHLERHLNERGIRFWRDDHDAPAGPLEKIIVRAIRNNPTVLLVLSESSVRSDWVECEVQMARALEKELGRHVLCPVALDKCWLTCEWSAGLRDQIKEYNVLDLSDWQDATAFEGKFQRLLSDIHVFYDNEGQR